MERTNKYYRQDTSAGVDERTSPPITSNRYEIGMPIGSGAWGIVYDAKDNVLNQDELAIKVLDMSQLAKAQMEYRGLTPLEVMIKDGGKLAACSRIVPRRLEFDNNNVPFLVMPQYQRHLSDILEDKDQETGEMNPVEQRRYLNHGLGKEQIRSYLSDFALAYREFHTILGRAHGDGKPENSYDVAVTRGNDKLLKHLKNVYRVLMSRAHKGVYVYFVDKDTEEYFRSKMEEDLK